jgi:hypothetical protein
VVARRTALFQLVDRVLDGQLEDRLRTWASAGVSRRAATQLLTRELGGIVIASETVRRWMKEAAAADPANGDEEAA